MSGPLQQIHLRASDAATGQATPVRMRVTDSAGAYYAPHGRLARFATAPNVDVGGNVLIDGQPWAYIDGACEIAVPPGSLRVQLSKGPEYKPVDEQVQLAAGKLSLRLQIERWTDRRRDGWHAGDARAHYVPPHAALLEAAAEDLAVASLLIREVEVAAEPGSVRAVPLLDAFSGPTPCLARPGHMVVVNTENQHPLLGSLGLVHCHRVVHPLTLGGADGHDDWTLEDWCGQCHRKKGLVVWTRTTHETPHFRHGEPLVDLLLGQVDAFEITPATWDALPLWYDLLNVGVRVPLAGASGKESNTTPLGAVRTYVHVGNPEATYTEWIEGLRGGRSVVSRGPWIHLQVNGEHPGAAIRVEQGTARIVAEARAWSGFDTLEVLQDGRLVASSSAAGTPATARIDQDIRVERNGWLAARCLAAGDVVAHTSAVYVELAGQPAAVGATDPAAYAARLADGEAAGRLIHEIDRMIRWGAERQRPTAGFRKARERLAAACGLANP